VLPRLVNQKRKKVRELKALCPSFEGQAGHADNRAHHDPLHPTPPTIRAIIVTVGKGGGGKRLLYMSVSISRRAWESSRVLVQEPRAGTVEIHT
jgi:hypothetical protein